MGALILVFIALPNISYAASSAPPTAPIAVDDAGTPGDTPRFNSANEIPEYPVSLFPMKNKLICLKPPATKSGFGSGFVLLENMGPGTLTKGSTIKIVILPSGRVISFTLPYDLPPHTGIFHKAYPGGITGGSCTFTATPHPKSRIPHP